MSDKTKAVSHQSKAQLYAKTIHDSAVLTAQTAALEGLTSFDDIPEEVLVKLYLAQMISPTRNANHVLKAVKDVAELKGMMGGKKGESGGAKEEVDAIMKRLSRNAIDAEFSPNGKT